MAHPVRILLASATPDDVAPVLDALRARGLDPRCFTAASASQLDGYLQDATWGLVLDACGEDPDHLLGRIQSANGAALVVVCGRNGQPLRSSAAGTFVLPASADPATIALLFDSRLALVETQQADGHLDRELRLRTRQQEVVAELGILALAGRDYEDLHGRAMRAVVETLAVPFAALLEPVTGSDLLLMRAGVGWRDGVVGHLLLNSGHDSIVGYTLEQGESVVVHDVPEAGSLNALPLFREHGIVSGVSVVLPGLEGPAGVLGAYCPHPHPFTRDDVHFLQAVANVLAAATERRAAEEGLLQSQMRLQSVQKMEAIGRLAGGIAHDFNNLVQAIGGYTEILLRRLPEYDPLRHSAEEIKRAGDRAAALTRQLLAFSRQQVLQSRVLDLNAVVAGVEQLLRRLIGEDVELETELATHLGAVRADEAQLEQVLMNLAVNARDAMTEGGTLTIETRSVTLSKADQREAFAIQPGPYIMLAVTDTGCGMDAETRARAFEPFFTTKPPGQGTGLGLSTVYGVVKQSGGYIWVDSEPGQGTRVRIYLPRVDDPVPPPEVRRPVAATPASGVETVLLVEDEEGVRDLISEWLRAHGYTVLTAADGHEALDLAEGVARIDLLVADVVMPHMGGPALAARLRPLRPGMRVIFVSGYADEAIGDPILQERGAGFLQKPFALDSLLRKVRDVLDRP